MKNVSTISSLGEKGCVSVMVESKSKVLQQEEQIDTCVRLNIKEVLAAPTCNVEAQTEETAGFWVSQRAAPCY